MSERPTKRLRRLSTEDDEEGSNNDDWIPQDVKAKTSSSASASRPTDTSRTRRGVAVPTSATISRGASASSTGTGTGTSQRLTLKVKAPPSKLREVTMGGSPTDTKQASPITSTSAPKKRASLSRGSRKPAVIEKDEDNSGDEDQDDDDDDAAVEAQIISRAPVKATATAGKATMTFRIPKKPGTESKKAAAPAPEQVLRTTPKVVPVEDKEMALAAAGSDDEELSELEEEEDEDAEGEPDDDEDDDEEEEDEEEDEDDEMEQEREQEEDEQEDDASDSEMPDLNALDQLRAAARSVSPSDADTSTTGTPDPTKLTRRQRGAPVETLLALSNEATKKKHFTADEISMRRAEMARRRKDLSEKRQEAEKTDTIRRLLEKQPSKKDRERERKSKKGGEVEGEETGAEDVGEGEQEVQRASKVCARIVMAVEGTKVGVPEEWAGTPVGRWTEGCRRVEGLRVVGGSSLVQEVE